MVLVRSAPTMALLPQHIELIGQSGITEEVAVAQQYWTAPHAATFDGWVLGSTSVECQRW